MSLLWINGQLVDKADARVSPFDHGFLYGDGVWEPLRVFGGKLFRPADHLARLYAAASLFGITVPLSREELTAAIEATVRANDRTDGYVRVIVTRGPGTLGPDPRKIDPQVLVIAEEYYPFPLELYDHGLQAITAPHPVNTLNPANWFRTLGRPDLVHAKLWALRAGCLEALLVDTGGGVIGSTEGEVFYVRGGTLHPVPPSSTVESQAVLDLARPVVPVDCTVSRRPTDLLAADEVFIAGASCGIIAVVRLDGQDIGSGTEGPVTRQIREAYRKLTRGA
jgi:branched-chain amino acid aminotransferase